MNISAVEPVITVSSQERTEVIFTSQDFMKLLIAQLQHQDPLNPVQSHEFMAQLAQLQSTATLNELHETLEDYTRKAGLLMPVGLLGRTIEWTAADGSVERGVVERVRFGVDKPMIMAAGQLIDISQIDEIW